eukprot:TRINITY_DN45391_c0_g1_i2.p1 TRINITY_DN45391_c0_g1~~TRINITY_DN45391_c0_g1_i2.p1  ORF type:complete len:156 (-),score=37.54 TRINITY_DN45391_c0_g1_i2:176-643(-)
MEAWLLGGSWSMTMPQAPAPSIEDALDSYGVSVHAGRRPRPASRGDQDVTGTRALADACMAADLRDAPATLAGLRSLAKRLQAAAASDAEQSPEAAAVDCRRELDAYAVSTLSAASAVDALLRILRLPPGWSGKQPDEEIEAAVLDAAASIVSAL